MGYSCNVDRINWVACVHGLCVRLCMWLGIVGNDAHEAAAIRHALTMLITTSKLPVAEYRFYFLC